MLTRLQAEERLNAIIDVGVGTGSMERRDARDVLKSLRKNAAVEEPKLRKASPMALAMAGIALVVPPVPPKVPNDG